MIDKKAELHDISEIHGLGPEKIRRLRDVGIQTVGALAFATYRELEVAGIQKEAKKFVSEALGMIGAKDFVKASDLPDAPPTLHTGSTMLDALFKGGYETQAVTEIVGEFASGKSQLAYTAAVMVQFPLDQGGLNGGALIIDSEATFRPGRIAEIAKARGLDPKEAVDRIFVAPAKNSDRQEELLTSADKVIQESNIRLIIVDSLIAHFRTEYRGRENLPERQGKINQHLHHILRLARAFDAAAIITNQVIAVPDMAYTHLQWKPAGGNILGHAAQLRIQLRKGQQNQRIARILDSSFIPYGEAPFCINERGIDDVGEEKPKEIAS